MSQTTERERPDLREQLRMSVILAALENLLKLDTDPQFRVVVSRRYITLTGGANDNS